MKREEVWEWILVLIVILVMVLASFHLLGPTATKIR